MEPKRSFTGHTRRRNTRWSVRIGEFLSRWIIRIGGIGTIGAVVLVGVFLVWVAVPLFHSSSLSAPRSVEVPALEAKLLRSGVDEYRMLSWELYGDGTLRVVRLDTGKMLQQRKLFPDAALTACSPPSKTDEIAFGFADGTVRLGRLGFKSRFLRPSEMADDKVRDLSAGEVVEYDGGLLRRMPDGKLRLQQFAEELDKPAATGNTDPIVLIDQTRRGELSFVTHLTAGGKLSTNSVSKRIHPATDETIIELDGGDLDIAPRPGQGQPSFLLVSGVGDNVFVAWDDGHVIRVSTQDLQTPRIVEEFNILGEPGVKLAALQFLLGKTTLLAGDSSGRIRAWFRTPQNVMVAAHDFGSTGSTVVCFGVSRRTRTFAAGYENGSVRLYAATSEKLLAETQAPRADAIRGVLIAPKDDGVIFRTSAALQLSDINAEQYHPEATWAALFEPVWYEGYEKPAHVWQATSSDDAYEPKLGFWPLIFGTLKATFYALLMGVPAALLAAVYTSEFLHPRTKAVVKPVVEMMASLPSVVLGFLAALVLAPFVERWLAAVIAGAFTLPGAFVLVAYLWQLLPEKLGLFLSRFRFVFILATLPVGVAAAASLGPLLERLLFQGDVKAWLNGNSPVSAAPGWFLLLLPLSYLTTLVLLAQFVNPWLRRRVQHLRRFRHALSDFAKFVAAAVFTVCLAILAARLLTALHLDPRGTFVGTYVQRNALIVGFMMGFAIMPIIFTIAEDALSAVPEHLRSASLGCGATPWQTATRIIMPTAMSGLFSAVMVGLGRAVGETMVVLMAAGATPIMEINIFNGFRTLSANIATELPEAVKDSTHYRTLFLAALTLFAMTFVLNTIAEVIRQRFRRRAFQL